LYFFFLHVFCPLFNPIFSPKFFIMKKFLIVLTLALPLAFAFTWENQAVITCTTCDTPANVTKTGQTASSISFSWDAVSGADRYKLSYSSNGFSSGDIYTGSASHTFSNLPAGRYTFSFSAVCGGGTSTAFIVVEDVSGL
jgi:hypothetical protein